jgi:hypothetical protein
MIETEMIVTKSGRTALSSVALDVPATSCCKGSGHENWCAAAKLQHSDCSDREVARLKSCPSISLQGLFLLAELWYVSAFRGQECPRHINQNPLLSYARAEIARRGTLSPYERYNNVP